MKRMACRFVMLAAMGVAALVNAAAAEIGVVVVAHGTNRGPWNQSVEQRLSGLRLPWPVEVAFLSSAEGNTMQKAFDRLEQSGVQRVVMVPLMISSHSSHIEEIRDYPVKTRLAVRMTGAIDYHPILSAEFRKRAKALSAVPGNESVILVGHGPNEDDNNQRWLEAFSRYAADLRSEFGFRAASGLTLRDDAPAGIRDQATAELRQSVADASRDGGRAIVLPVLIGSGGVMSHVRERLKGLDYQMDTDGLIAGDALPQWLVAVVSSTIVDWTARATK